MRTEKRLEGNEAFAQVDLWEKRSLDREKISRTKLLRCSMPGILRSGKEATWMEPSDGGYSGVRGGQRGSRELDHVGSQSHLMDFDLYS